MNLKKILAIVLIAGSSLTLLPSCKTNSNPKQNPPTNERNQVEKELKIGGSTSTYAVVKILADAYASKIKNADITFLPPSQSESTILPRVYRFCSESRRKGNSQQVWFCPVC
jgi:phosphate transport system substrate-binding protein